MENKILKQENNFQKKIFPVTGMSCAACAVSVESILKLQEGVLDANVNYASQSVKVNFDPSVTSAFIFQKALQSIGYGIIIDEIKPKEKQSEIQKSNFKKLKWRMVASGIFSFPVFITGMFFMNIENANIIMMIFSAPVVFYFGGYFFKNAFRQLRFGITNMDTLVAMSTGIAFSFSAFNTIYPQFWHSRSLHAHVYFEPASVIIFFVLLGKYLEEKAKNSSSLALKNLIGSQPKTALIMKNNEVVEVPIETVEVNDIILIKPGQKIPVDGIISAGLSQIDESLISGEAMPVEKGIGAQVFAGTFNQLGSFYFKAEKVGAETLLANIIKTVEEAQASKPPVQKLVDKIASIFVPAVLIIAVLTFLIWMIFGGEKYLSQAFISMVAVLIIACPCALGLATPTAIMVGLGKAATNGILIKDAESLEQAYQINTLVLDKTGTITLGKPVVDKIIWYGGINDSELLNFKKILFSIELYSEHPLAKAITQHLKEEKIESVDITDFKSITSKGIISAYKNKKYLVGNAKFLNENNIFLDEEINNETKKLFGHGKTVLFFSEGQKVKAIISIADALKQNSVKAIKKLKQMGIDIFMLTGDNKAAAKNIADQVGILNFQADFLPSDKVDFIKKLQAEGKIVAMAGDGINDSPALAQANVSIAMGSGSDLAMDVAKITLITSDLMQVSKAISLSKKTVKIIRQNLFWAFIYNLIGIPLAAGLLFPINGFLLNPMIASAAMALSSVSVVGNSLRLK